MLASDWAEKNLQYQMVLSNWRAAGSHIVLICVSYYEPYTKARTFRNSKSSLAQQRTWPPSNQTCLRSQPLRRRPISNGLRLTRQHLIASNRRSVKCYSPVNVQFILVNASLRALVVHPYITETLPSHPEHFCTWKKFIVETDHKLLKMIQHRRYQSKIPKTQ